MKNKKILFVMLLLVLPMAYAHGDDFEDVEHIIEDEVPCEALSEEQLELIGDYYMEQMHPGEAHELMDEMMGGEGSESLKQMHIQMARRLYCGEDIGMMGMMVGGMMNMMGGGKMMGYGMMGTGYGFGYWSFLYVLYVILLIGLIVLVYLAIIRLWRSMDKKKRK